MKDRSIDYDMPMFSLKVFPLDAFQPERAKKGGSRKGAIGHFGDNKPYMLKIESGGYSLETIGNPLEVSIAESFSAQLIRGIWGAQFASNIHLVESKKKSYSMPLFYEKPIILKHQFNIASEWIEGGKVLSIKQQFVPEIENPLSDSEAIHLTKIQTIARLLDVVDYKPSNIVYTSGIDSSFFVDCAVSLYFYKSPSLNELFNPLYKKINLGEKYFKKDSAIETIQSFVDFNNLDVILDQYKLKFSDKTFKRIKPAFVKLQYDCKIFLESQQNQANPPSIKSEKPLEQLTAATSNLTLFGNSDKRISTLEERIKTNPQYNLEKPDLPSMELSQLKYRMKEIETLQNLALRGDDVAIYVLAKQLEKGIVYMEKIDDHYYKQQNHTDLDQSLFYWNMLKEKGYLVSEDIMRVKGKLSQGLSPKI